MLICAQWLVFAHGFDHPVGQPHANHDCPSCSHGHLGAGPAPATVAQVAPPASSAPVPVCPVSRPVADTRAGYRVRAPPVRFV
ncbi:hypothetical protein [Salinisphaera sp. T31B1]|uniref:hypothetical protein n=1 Tax=Salinisphaera sp. T31B1 TaxID=727963 RepID=UPI0033400D86